MSLEAVTTLLFVPAWDAGAIVAALASPASAVAVDLEDLTPHERKEEARRGLAAALAQPRAGGAIGVRVNASSPELREADLAAVARLPVDFLLVPKATPRLLAELGPSELPRVAIVETAAGLRDAHEIASAPGVAALALGANDLAADLGLGGPLARDALAYARAKIMFDSAAAGLRAPFDRVTPAAAGVDDVIADARAACEIGFGGKACTRVAHAVAIDEVFAQAPTPAGVVACS